MTALLESVATLRDAGYRVLSPFVVRDRVYSECEAKNLRVAAIVDVETTGLDADAEIVQLAIQRVMYDAASGVLLQSFAPWVALNAPSKPIPAEATALHGITDEMVRGHTITEIDVAKRLDSVGLLIAHKASFDAPIFCRTFPTLKAYPWACSLEDVAWPYESKRLGALLQDHTQQHFQGHDAGRDVAAVAEILATPFADGTPPFALMLASARAPRVRIEARGAPFDAKDALKARGYRWNASGKVWWTEVMEPNQHEEGAWIRTVGGMPVGTLVDARTRFL